LRSVHRVLPFEDDEGNKDSYDAPRQVWGAIELYHHRIVSKPRPPEEAGAPPAPFVRRSYHKPRCETKHNTNRHFGTRSDTGEVLATPYKKTNLGLANESSDAGPHLVIKTLLPYCGLHQIWNAYRCFRQSKTDKDFYMQIVRALVSPDSTDHILIALSAVMEK
jgi:hypothetical protein